MTHYNIVYTDLPPEEKSYKALQDIADWLGSKRKFRELTEAFIYEGSELTQQRFAFYCSLAGVQGYPVIAWWEHCFPKRPWEDEDEEEEYQLCKGNKEDHM
jgi:hypothetical protein